MSDPTSPHLEAALLADATRTVDDLIAQLEPALDHDHRRLLHRLRLASESLGMLRSTTQMLGMIPVRGGRPTCLDDPLDAPLSDCELPKHH